MPLWLNKITMKKIIFIFSLLTLTANCFAQKQFTFSSSNSMFPLKTANPKYPSSDSKFNDNSCLVYVPKHFDKNKTWHFMLWFHGWNNNIQSTIEQFKLREQIILSCANVILIMPEGVKNGNDSYCGNWEQANYFNYFMEDVKLKLKSEKIVDNITANNQLIISGHSGASRALVQVMDYSSTTIKSILMFDAIYSHETNIIKCLKKFPSCKLINLHTSREACTTSTKNLIQLLQKEKINYLQKQDTDVKDAELKSNRILCLSSNLSHNDVPVSYNYLSRFLKASE